MKKVLLKKISLVCFLPATIAMLSSCNRGPNLDEKIEDKKRELAYLEKVLDSVKAELHGGKATAELKEEATTEAMVSGFASIKNIDTDFFTTSSYNNGKPGKPKSAFKPGERVYIWASISAPKNETVKLKWKDSNGNVFEEKSYNVASSAGYRIYSWKSSFPNITGSFSVELYNSQGHRIGGSDFSVN